MSKRMNLGDLIWMTASVIMALAIWFAWRKR